MVEQFNGVFTFYNYERSSFIEVTTVKLAATEFWDAEKHILSSGTLWKNSIVL